MISNFYSSGEGDRLVDADRYPGEIVQFLRDEVFLLGSVADSFDVLVEVGCMDGRYVDWASHHSKRYVGIDVVERYIEEGRRRLSALGASTSQFMLEVHSATQLHKPSFKSVIGDVSDALALFPFNSFGNMGRPQEVIRSLALSRIPFLISSYSTDTHANSVRANYYENCAYDDLKCNVSEAGVSFLSKDGLNTIAYHRDYLIKLFKEFGLNVSSVVFSPMGVAYKSQ